MTRYMVQPRSVFEVPRRNPRDDNEAPIVIDNPTDRAIMVTIDAPEVVAARDPRSQPQMFFSQANDPNSWGRQFEAAAQRLDHEGASADPNWWARQNTLERDDIVEWLNRPQIPEAQITENLIQLEREMQARNMESLQARQRAQVQQYQAYLERLGNGGGGEVNPVPPPEEERARANLRARKLLLEHLSSEQRSEFLQTDGFRVKGSTTDLIYRIENGGRVVRLSDCNEFCLQVVGEWVPHFDAMLARKILLECDEPQFLATANNLTRGNPGRAPAPVEFLWREQPMESVVTRFLRGIGRSRGAGAR